MKTPRFSIIIPAYNVESIIRSTLSSIPENRYDSLEIIVVNDGSTDNTKEEVVKYKAESNLDIQIITTANMGPAHARNIGIERATGEYTLFMDSDDLLESQIFNRLEETLLNHKSLDIIIFGFQITNASSQIINTYSYDLLSFSKKDVKNYFAELYKSNLLNQVWNKVYKTSLIKTISFENLKYGEDRIFVIDYLRTVHTGLVIEDILYNYRIVNNDSLISKFHSDKFEATLLIDERVKGFAKKSGATLPSDNAALDYMLIKGIISCMTILFANSCPYSRKERLESIGKIITHPKVVATLSHKNSTSSLMKALSTIIKTQNIHLNYYLARCIHFSSVVAPRHFTELKHNKK